MAFTATYPNIDLGAFDGAIEALHERTTVEGSAEPVGDTITGECEWCGDHDANETYSLIVRLLGGLDTDAQQRVLDRFQSTFFVTGAKKGSAEGVELASADDFTAAELSSDAATFSGAREEDIDLEDFDERNKPLDATEMDFAIGDDTGAADDDTAELEADGATEAVEFAVGPQEDVSGAAEDAGIEAFEIDDETSVAGAAERKKHFKIVEPAPTIDNDVPVSIDDFQFVPDQPGDIAGMPIEDFQSVADASDNPEALDIAYNDWSTKSHAEQTTIAMDLLTDLMEGF
jgi:hypothetical protein